MKQFYLKTQFLLVTVFIFLSFISNAQVPTYYNGTNISQTGNALKTSLSNLIISTHSTYLTYTPGVWDALKQTDLDPNDPTKVLLIYGYDDSDADLINDRTRSKDKNGGNQGDWNREHVFPRSLGNPNLGSEGPGSDAHHLRASDVNFNAIRNNYTFGAGSGNAKLVNNIFYPGDEWKGDVARMIMYMYLHYGTQCLPSVVTVSSQNYSTDMTDILLEWNAEDPVSQVEINRNTILEGVQGNRNPFIDNPAFETTIWGGPQAQNRFDGSIQLDTEIPSVPTSLVATNTTSSETTLTWVQSTDNVGVLGYRIYNGSVLSAKR